MVKTLALILISITVVIGSVILNFNEFLMGNPATLKNLIVTFVYIISCIIVLIISIKIKNLMVLTYATIFWLLTLITGLLTIFTNVTGISSNLELPFAIILITEWYGLVYFEISFLIASIIISIISLGMFLTSFISIKIIMNSSVAN